MRMVDPHTLEDLIVQDFGQVEDDYNAPFMFFHRVDLHTALKDMAVSRDLPGTPVVINNGQSVSSLNCEDGTIVLANGDVFHKDLIVIADGVRVSQIGTSSRRKDLIPFQTKFINNITQKDTKLEDAGFSFYRCLIPFEEAKKDPDLASIFKDQEPGFWVPFEHLTGTYLVTYPCRDQKMLNVAFRHETKPDNEHADDWNTDTNIDDVVAMVERFHPSLPKLFKLTSSLSVHKIFRREPLDTYTRGRAVIIGDAAHPMQPTHGTRLTIPF
jgi:2-polyprenyl-6-methoxyphenol hydroxylase-like FAD-dependent oxidoreductase